MEFINNLQQIVTSHAPRTPERIFLASLFALRGLKLLGSLWKYIKPLPKLNKAYANSWAVITGGTSGIGLELAEKFAQNGLNLILIARNATNLEKVSTMLASKYSNIQVIWISLDANAPNWENVMKTLSQCPISILVNNVGVHNSIPANIDQLSLDEIARIINVNCLFQVQFTSLVVPIMKNYRNTYTGQPKIINISSLTSKLDMPMLSVYAASKAFIDHWSINLAAELANDNISVLCLRPGLTVSPMSGEKKSSLFIPTAEAMATACYRMITERDLLIVPYLPHLFLDYINQFIPRSLTWSIVRDMHQKKRNELLDLELEASISPAKVSSTAAAETTTTSPTTPTTPRTK